MRRAASLPPFHSLTLVASLVVLSLLNGQSESRAAEAEDAAPNRSARALDKKVLLIGIDGCRFDALQVAKTPHLRGLMEAGIYANNTAIFGERYQKADTVSGPGWSSIMTGVWADKHGVHDNKFRGANYAAFPVFFRRIKDARPKARTVSIVTWEPIHDKIISAADVSLKFVQPPKAYAQHDAEAARFAVRELSENNPDAFFLYFGQVDETGHAKGFSPKQPEYIAAIEQVDTHIGAVLAAVRARRTFAAEDWLIIVTSDHGGAGKDHGNGHRSPEITNSFLIVSGPSAQRGKFTTPTYIVDAPVTALAHLGIPLAPDWNLDGRPIGLATQNPAATPP